jgi:DNA-binding NtrC family response regulator
MSYSFGEAIMVVGESEERAGEVSKLLSGEGYHVQSARNWDEAAERCRRVGYPALMTGFAGADSSAQLGIKKIKSSSPDTRVVLVTDEEMMDLAVQAMKEGTIDGMLGSFSVERLEHSVRKIVELVPRRNKFARPIIGESRQITGLIAKAEKIAGSSATVLIQGETGTGKELLARHIHTCSPRNGRPFVAINCAALPETLMESELFGHEKGAFTGAVERKAGKFELAQGGTILLDEIGELNMVAQAKLLRVLQEKEVDRIGGKEPVPVDVRVIATTNRDLKVECAKGRFREDLYYRLNVISFTVPALCERASDIPALVGYFVEKHCRANGVEMLSVDAETVGMLSSRRWEGNVRELCNVLEKAVLLSEGGRLSLEGVFEDGCGDGEDDDDAEGSFRDMEKKLIMKALEEAGGNKTHAARKLGVSARTIRNKLRSYENLSM